MTPEEVMATKKVRGADDAPAPHKLAPVWSSDQHNWRTPERVLEVVRSLGAGIVLDPCTDADNPIGAPSFYTPAEDGLARSWHREIGGTSAHGGLAFVNPTYGDGTKLWVAKAIDEARSGLSSIVLVASRTDVPWFHDALAASSAVVFCKGRLRFVIPGKPSTGAPFPSVLFCFEGDAPRFGSLFVGAAGFARLGAWVVTRPCAVWPGKPAKTAR